MKVLRILAYLVGSAARSIRTGWRMHLLTVGTTAVTLFMVGALFLVFQNIRSAVMGSKGEGTFSVYFRPNATEQNMTELKDRLCAQSMIETCDSISADEAKKRFVRNHPETAEAVKSLKENPFPASVEVEFKKNFRDVSKLKALVSNLSSDSSVESVDDGGEWLTQWIRILDLLDVLMLGLVLAISLATIFVISNTIRLVVFARKDEVEILKLVGASDWMIRSPFLLEGMVQGLLGSFLALIALRIVFYATTTYVISQWGGLVAKPLVFFPLSHVLLLIGAGLLLGLLGSAAAIGRFLKT